jgi:hypothetical protein
MIINARSPYIIEVNEAGQTGSKIEIFIWNSGLQPTNPTYNLSKAISSSNNLLTTYNISSFIREFFNFADNSTSGVVEVTPTDQYVNVVVKRYKYDGSYTLIDTTTYIAFDGYSNYLDGYNYSSGNIRALQGSFYYNLATADSGQVVVVTETDWKVRYTNLVDLTTNTAALPNDSVLNVPKIRTFLGGNNYDEGNLFEILNDVNAVIFTATYFPKSECKYTPVQCDYINQFGAWNRIWFYVKSTSKFKTENKDYNLLQSNLVNYDVTEGQKMVFNANAKETIEVNTDWVSEDFSEIIKELMLSERILIDDKAAILNTKDTELFKNINTNLINYKLEFEFAFDFIQNVM